MLLSALRDPFQPVLRSPTEAAVGFLVGSLFASGEQGAWYDPSDLSTMYQDSAGTTPAAVGQPVGRINDKSGRGNHATQATAASRPTLNGDGGYYSNEFDGVDDHLTCASGGGGTTGFFFCAAVRVNGGAGTIRCIFSDRGVNTGHTVRVSTTNALEFGAGQGGAYTLVSTGALPVGETHVITAWDDGVNLKVQIDNGAEISVPRPAIVAGTAGFTLGRENAGALEHFPGRIGSPIYRHGTVVDATLRERVKRFVAFRAGVSLL